MKIRKIFKKKIPDKFKAKINKYLQKVLDSIIRIWLKFPKFGKYKIRIFAQSPEVWPSLDSVWDAFSLDAKVDTLVVLLPFLHDSPSANSLEKFLLDRGISFIHGEKYNMLLDRPDLVFFQNPYDSTRPKQYHSTNLKRYNIKFAYVPYGLEVGGGSDNIQWQYNQHVQKEAWRVFARSNRHKEMFRKYCDSRAKNVVVTGHPKLDLLIKAKNTQASLMPRSEFDNKRIVLWSSHFTVGNPPLLWSTYQLFSEYIFKYFMESKSMVLIFRPHPLFFSRMRNEGILTESQEAEFKVRLNECPNVILDENPSYIDSFLLSDALMSDAGSFLLEYLPTENPILYLENPNGPGLNEEGSIVDSYYVARRISDISKFLTMIDKGQDPLRNERLSRISEFLYKMDGMAGNRIKEHVLSALANDAKLN